MIKVSVIIPVYNSGDSIKVTLDSIINQNNPQCDIEIIAVNNASTDDSLSILEEYSKWHSNMLVLNLTEASVCKARNAGILKAKGDYITFVDAGDYVSNMLYYEVSNMIDKFNPDIIHYGWSYVTNDQIMPPKTYSHAKNILLDREYIKSRVLPQMLNLQERNEDFIDDFVVNKFYKASIISDFDIKFDVNRRKWEDRPFVVEFLRYADNICFLDGPLYYYVRSEGSLSSKFDNTIFETIVCNYKLYTSWFADEYNFESNYSNNYWFNSIYNQMLELIKYTRDGKTDKDECIDMIGKICDDKQIVKWFDMHTGQDEYESRIKELVLNKDAKKIYETLIAAYDNKMKLIEDNNKKANSPIRRILRRIRG